MRFVARQLAQLEVLVDGLDFPGVHTQDSRLKANSKGTILFTVCNLWRIHMCINYMYVIETFTYNITTSSPLYLLDASQLYPTSPLCIVSRLMIKSMKPEVPRKEAIVYSTVEGDMLAEGTKVGVGTFAPELFSI